MANATELPGGPDLLRAAKKRSAGQKLTQAEERALRRHEQQLRHRYGQAYLRELPKKDYLASTGVANKVILEQAQKLGLPWNPYEKTVDAGAMLAAFHRLISDNPKGFYRAASKAALDEFFPDEAAADWQGECFKERALELADKRKVRRGEMLDAAAVAAILGRIAERNIAFVQALGKRFGDAAQRMAQQSWEDQREDVERLLSGSTDADGSDSETLTGGETRR
jgi:hypothetical protein